MPITTSYTLHTDGPALWPDHKPLEEVLELQATTPDDIFQCTYQGRATPRGGLVFLRAWWLDDQTRYDPTDRAYWSQSVGRLISWDTAEKDKETSAWTVGTVFDLLADYRVAVRHIERFRSETPTLIDEARAMAERWNHDGLLRWIVIEDRSSGTTLYQTLSQAQEGWIRGMLYPFLSSDTKEMRAKQASVWCKNACVLIPWPDQVVPWLLDWEEEVFNFPGVTYKDQVDSFSQGVIYLEHLLSAGYRRRMGYDLEDEDAPRQEAQISRIGQALAR
jgi:predicted phage terminase large subunit-like protein